MNIDPAVVIEKCAGCGIPIAPILLPVSIRLDIAEDPEGSPMGALELVVGNPARLARKAARLDQLQQQMARSEGLDSAIRLTGAAGQGSPG